MPSGLMGEFVGTAVLVLLGNGVVANVLLARSKGQGSGWIVITAGWGFAVLCGILVATAMGSPGHLNPVVSLANFASGNLSAPDLGAYVIIQVLGGMLGAVLVWLSYLPHWRETESASDKLGCFCTSPAIKAPASNLVTEAIGAFILVLVVFALGTGAVSQINLPGPLIVGFLVWSLGLSLGGPTGYAINPARDLGPRIVHALLPIHGKGSSEWSYAWVPIVGPAIGAVAAALLAGVIFI